MFLGLLETYSPTHHFGVSAALLHCSGLSALIPQCLDSARLEARFPGALHLLLLLMHQRKSFCFTPKCNYIGPDSNAPLPTQTHTIYLHMCLYTLLLCSVNEPFMPSWRGHFLLDFSSLSGQVIFQSRMLWTMVTGKGFWNTPFP